MLPTKLVALTGRTRSGKDHTALVLKLPTLSIPDPIYEICDYFLGNCDKSNPLHRRFLQLVGAWGRGLDPKDVPPGIPSSKEIYTALNQKGCNITPKLHTEVQIDWSQFGKTQDFWLKIITQRIQSRIQRDGQNTQLAIPNTRFSNELETFQRLGFLHLHITCSKTTLLQRRGKDNWMANDNDPTEELAKTFDLSLHGPTVIWNDPQNPPPKNRGYTTIENLAANNQ